MLRDGATLSRRSENESAAVGPAVHSSSHGQGNCNVYASIYARKLPAEFHPSDKTNRDTRLLYWSFLEPHLYHANVTQKCFLERRIIGYAIALIANERKRKHRTHIVGRLRHVANVAPEIPLAAS